MKYVKISCYLIFVCLKFWGIKKRFYFVSAFLNAKYGQSVLAGDPNQLGPVVLSRYAKEFGLGESLLVRLLHTPLYQKDIEGFRETHGYNPHLVTLLVENYRSLPEILALPSNLFYNGLLDPKVCVTKIYCNNSKYTITIFTINIVQLRAPCWKLPTDDIIFILRARFRVKRTI